MDKVLYVVQLVVVLGDRHRLVQVHDRVGKVPGNVQSLAGALQNLPYGGSVELSEKYHLTL